MLIVGDNLKRYKKEENYHIVCPKLRSIRDQEIEFDISIPLDRYLNLFTLGETDMAHKYGQVPIQYKDFSYVEDKYVAFKIYLIDRVSRNLAWTCDFPDYFLSMLSKEFARLASRGLSVKSNILRRFSPEIKNLFKHVRSEADLGFSRCKAIKYTLGEVCNFYDLELARNPLPAYAVGPYQKYKTGDLPIYKNFIYEPLLKVK